MTTRSAARLVYSLYLLATFPAIAGAHAPDRFPILEATLAQLQAETAAGHLTSEQLTRAYIQRIEHLDQAKDGHVAVNSIIEINPDALAIARRADALRRKGKVLGPLHGIPVLLKANIDTGDQMQTTAGSQSLQGTPPLQDSTVAAKLRSGGAVILGKTNQSEWANFRSFESVSGWSAVGGQTHNPYGLDRNPCGSSSGSGAAESANFATLSIGTETDGSIVCPADATSVDLDAAGFTFPSATGETLVLEFDFKGDVQSYFATRIGVPVAKGTLQDAINFNDANADAEMPFWGQDVFTETQALLPGADTPQTDPNLGVPVGTTYNQALAIDKAATVNGIDAALAQFHLDAVIAPTDNPAWSTDLLYGDHFVFGSSGLGAPGGYPYVQVPASQVFGIPFGITFFGTAFSEPKLITLASGFEAVTQARLRNLPQFTATIPDDHIAGEPLKTPHRNRPKDWSPRHL